MATRSGSKTATRNDRLRSRPRTPKWFGLCALGPLLLAGLGGCGGKSDSSADVTSLSTEIAAKDKAMRAAADPYFPPAGQGAPARDAAKSKPAARPEPRLDAPAPVANPKAAAAAALPSDYDLWTTAHFIAARAAREPRLLPALEHRTQQPLRTAEEAYMLVLLLAAPTRGAAGPPATSAPALMQAVTAAMMANDTPQAHAALLELVEGKLAAENEQGAIGGALAILARRATTGTEAILLRTILTPEQVRTSGQDRMSAEGLRTAAIAAVRTDGSRRIKNRLAVAVADPDVSPDVKKLLLPMLLEPKPENLEAHVALYQSGAMDEATRTQMEQRFTGLSRGALATVLGFAAKDGANPMTADAAARVAGVLWTPSLADAVDRRQQACQMLADGAEAYRLATAIPTDAMRSRLHRTLDRQWREALPPLAGGPPAGGNPAAGAASKTVQTADVFDPGLIVLVKLAGRENRRADPPPVRTVKKAPHSPHTLKSSKPKEPPPPPPPLADWEQSLMGMVGGLCRRCHIAALASGTSSSPSAVEVVSLELDTDIAPAAQYRIDWPGPWREQLPQAATDHWRLSYLRIEERAKPSKVVSHYRRQVKACVEHTLPHSIWLNGLDDASDSSQKRSTDVLLTQVNEKVGGDEDQPVIVEILTIEVRDPGGDERLTSRK